MGRKTLFCTTEQHLPTVLPALPWASISLFIPMSGKQIRLMDDVYFPKYASQRAKTAL